MIDRIDFSAILEHFFFDTDFLMGPLLLEAEERALGHLLATPQAWKIAAGLKPEPEDLELVRVEGTDTDVYGPPDPDERPVPRSGYVGPYPLLEPADLIEP